MLEKVQALSFIPIPDQLLTYLVQKAPPGLLTSADVPLRGFAGRFNI